MAWFHIATVVGFTTKGSWLYLSGSRAWVGVELFFVISGFVIPYSLWRSSYVLSDFGRFILKRIIRLDPPYLAAIVVWLLIAAWYSGTTGAPYPYSPLQVLLHLGYLNVFSSYPWIDRVFWTLAVEVQFYVLIGLAFPLLQKRNLFWLVVAPLCMAAALGLRDHISVFRYLPFFLLGVAALHHRRGMIERLSFIVIILVLAIGCKLVLGRAPAIVGFATALAIANIKSAPRMLVGLGSISYSLYLLHGPVSALVKMLFGYPPNQRAELGFVMMAMSASVVAAWILYRTVELPSRRWSKRIHYRGA